MDLNYLLSRHQVSLVRSQNAASVEARFAHRMLAKSYAARIVAHQEALGAPGTALVEA